MILHPLDNHPHPIAKIRRELLPHILTLTVNATAVIFFWLYRTLRLSLS